MNTIATAFSIMNIHNTELFFTSKLKQPQYLPSTTAGVLETVVVCMVYIKFFFTILKKDISCVPLLDD